MPRNSKGKFDYLGGCLAGCLAATLVLLGGCATYPVSYDTALPVAREALFEYSYLKDQPTGIAVSHEGRIFVNFPRWDKDPLYSVAEVMTDGTLRPYPGFDWNRWGNDEAKSPRSPFCLRAKRGSRWRRFPLGP